MKPHRTVLPRRAGIRCVRICTQKHKRGRPRRGIREHMPWLQHEVKCCRSPSQWKRRPHQYVCEWNSLSSTDSRLIVFVRPQTEQRQFSSPWLYVCIATHASPHARFCSNVDAAIDSTNDPMHMLWTCSCALMRYVASSDGRHTIKMSLAQFCIEQQSQILHGSLMRIHIHHFLQSPLCSHLVQKWNFYNTAFIFILLWYSDPDFSPANFIRINVFCMLAIPFTDESASEHACQK